MPASFLHVLPGLVGAWGEIWHGGALELSAFDRLAATARRPGGQKLCRSAIRRSERAGGGPPPARSAQCLQAPGRELRLRATIEHAGSLAVRESSTLHGRFDCGNSQSGHSLCSLHAGRPRRPPVRLGCGGGVPSSHPSLGLSVFFLFFFTYTHKHTHMHTQTHSPFPFPRKTSRTRTRHRTHL